MSKHKTKRPVSARKTGRNAHYLRLSELLGNDALEFVD